MIFIIYIAFSIKNCHVCYICVDNLFCFYVIARQFYSGYLRKDTPGSLILNIELCYILYTCISHCYLAYGYNIRFHAWRKLYLSTFFYFRHERSHLFCGFFNDTVIFFKGSGRTYYCLSFRVFLLILVYLTLYFYGKAHVSVFGSFACFNLYGRFLHNFSFSFFPFLHSNSFCVGLLQLC